MTVLLPYTGLLLSSASELSKFIVLFDSVKTNKTGCYNILLFDINK